MDETGTDLRQHTRHAGWDVRDPAVSNGRLVYQVGADLWLYDVATGREQLLDKIANDPRLVPEPPPFPDKSVSGDADQRPRGRCGTLSRNPEV